jgi:hypothetical protein
MKTVFAALTIGSITAGVVIGATFPPRPMSHLIYQAGTSLCKPNEGLKQIQAPGRFGDNYTFICQNTAQFIDVPVTIADPVPAKEPLATRDVVKGGS